MTLIEFIRLVAANIRYLIIVPLLLAVSVFLFTMNQPKTYVSKTMIYTGIASGFSIENQDQGRIDYHAVNNAFDNFINTLMARQTLEEVGLRLLAQHLMLEKPDPEIISLKSYEELKKLIPEDERSMLVVPGDLEKTVTNLFIAANSNGYSSIKEILSKSESPYSLKTLSTITAKRIKSSDMVEIAYRANDPGIARQTLVILLDVFTERYVAIKEAETGNVVKYFEEQLAKAKEKLTVAEARMTEFREKNKIINYQEQTRYLAEKHEDVNHEYKQELMALNAAKAGLAELEKKIGIKENIYLTSDEIMMKRQRLSELMTRIALMETEGEDEETIAAFRKVADGLKEDLKNSINNLYTFTHSTEGVPIKQLLTEWLDHLLKVYAHQARAEVLRHNLREIDEKYSIFAPLGSALDDLQREIDIAEKEYLEILHSLNMARLHQQNNQLSANIEVVDEPYYPLEPEPSKRKLLIIGAFIGGILLVLGTLIAIELLDNSVKKPERAVELTGLKLAGAFPAINHRLLDEMPHLIDELTDQVVGNIKMTSLERRHKPHKLITILSIQKGEGKSFAGELIVEKLRAINGRVLFLSPEHKHAQSHPDNISYTPGHHLIDSSDISELAGGDIDLSLYTYIIVETPAVLKGKIPLALIRESDISLLVLRADRAWQEVDTYTLKNLLETGVKPPLLVLNAAEVTQLEGIIGEIPKKRSKLRKWLKQVLTMQFKTPKYTT